MSVASDQWPRPLVSMATTVSFSSKAAVAPAPSFRTQVVTSACAQVPASCSAALSEAPNTNGTKGCWIHGFQSVKSDTADTEQVQYSDVKAMPIRIMTRSPAPRSLPPIATVGRFYAAPPLHTDGDTSAWTVQPMPSSVHKIPSKTVRSTICPTRTRTHASVTAVSNSPLSVSSRAQSPFHHRPSLADTPTLACTVTLEELLTDTRQYPLSLNEFRRYMISQYTDEMVEFLLDVKKYKTDTITVMSRQEKEVAGTVLRGESTAEGIKRISSEKDRILQRYLAAGSEREINVSWDVRKVIEQLNLCSPSNAVSPTTSAYDCVLASPSMPYSQFSASLTSNVSSSALLTVFDQAVREICDLTEQGKFVQRFWRQQTRNIDQRDINLRYIIGSIHLIVACAIVLTLILTSSVRWYRFFAFPLNFYGAMTLCIARCGVCPILTSLRSRIPDQDGKWDWWTVVSGRCDSELCRVVDVDVMKEMNEVAKKVWIKALLMSSLLTTAYLALP